MSSKSGWNRNFSTSCHCPLRRHLKKGWSPSSLITPCARAPGLLCAICCARADQCCCQSGTNSTALALCSRRSARTRGTSRNGGKAQFQPTSADQSWVNAFGGLRAPGSWVREQKRGSRQFARQAKRSQVSTMPISANEAVIHAHRAGVTCHSNRSASDRGFGNGGRLSPSTQIRTISTPEMWTIADRLILCLMNKPQIILVR